MLKKCIWVLCLTSIIFAISLDNYRNVSSLRLLGQPISSVYPLRAHWAYRSREESHRSSFEGITHGSTLKATQNLYERPNELELPQKYWWPSSGWQNLSIPNYYGYAKPLYEYSSRPSGGSGFSYKSSMEKYNFRYPYQQTTLNIGNHGTTKKTPSKHSKEKPYILNLSAPGKSTFKKTVSHDSPPKFKNIIFSRIAKPYLKYSYPAQNYPFHKRYYYQSPYQKYAIPSKSEMLRYEDKSLNSDYYIASTASPNRNPGRHHTTERVDDAYPDGSTTWEDYFAYNDTSNDSGNYYKESFEEVEKTFSNSEVSSNEEGTTRGYYGDRIYMSTHMPLTASDRTGVKNKYFIVRKTSHADDIETLFE